MYCGDVLLAELRALGQSITELCLAMAFNVLEIKILAAFPSNTCSRLKTVLTDAASSNVKKANPRDVPDGSRIIVHASTFA